MADIRFSPKSLHDLQEIRDYIADDLCNSAAADSIVSGILDKIKVLSCFPEIGSPLSAVTEIETKYRFLVCGNYMVFYRAEDGTVYIIRIIYGRRNYIGILFGEQN